VIDTLTLKKDKSDGYADTLVSCIALAERSFHGLNRRLGFKSASEFFHWSPIAEICIVWKLRNNSSCNLSNRHSGQTSQFIA
jgi:hypothetical protein